MIARQEVTWISFASNNVLTDVFSIASHTDPQKTFGFYVSLVNKVLPFQKTKILSA